MAESELEWQDFCITKTKISFLKENTEKEFAHVIYFSDFLPFLNLSLKTSNLKKVFK